MLSDTGFENIITNTDEDWMFVKLNPDANGMVKVPKDRYDRIQDLLVYVANTDVILEKIDAKERYEVLKDIVYQTRDFLGWEIN